MASENSSQVLVGVSGHRPNRMFRGSEDPYSEENFLILKDFAVGCLEHLRQVWPVSSVYSGMALGVDQAFAAAALELGIPLVAVIPFLGQEMAWHAQDRKRYQALVEAAADRIVLSGVGYSPEKLRQRSRWIVDHTDLDLFVYDSSRFGGTAETWAYALSKGKRMYNFWVKWQDHWAAVLRNAELPTITQLPPLVQMPAFGRASKPHSF